MILPMTRFVRLLRGLAVVGVVSSFALPALAVEAVGSPGPPPVARPTPPPASRMDPLPPSPLLDEANAAPAVDDALDRDPRALTHWNQDLAPYGTWIDDPSYGRVWVPDARVVGSDFTPYASSGHWALDQNEAWVWVSDYPFGDVVFHYGRWVWTSSAGWAWIPGLQYAPAWVAWRTPVDGYADVGWAPYPPSWVWFGGISVWYGWGPYYPWVYCASAYLFYPHVHHYIYTDPYYVYHAEQYTRPYYPANPRPSAAPASPSMRAAAVPTTGVPRERVSSQDLVSAPGARTKAAAGLASRTAAAPRSDLAGGPPRSSAPGVAPLYQSRQGSSRRAVAPSDLVASGARSPRVDAASSVRSFRPENVSRSTPHFDAGRISPMRSTGSSMRSTGSSMRSFGGSPMQSFGAMHSMGAGARGRGR